MCTVANAFCVRSQPSFIDCEAYTYCALAKNCKRANRRRVRRTTPANRTQSHPVKADLVARLQDVTGDQVGKGRSRDGSHRPPSETIWGGGGGVAGVKQKETITIVSGLPLNPRESHETNKRQMPKHQFHSTNSRPATKTYPQIDMLGLDKMHENVKDTQYALKQPLGGPCNIAWLCINISVFTVPLSDRR